MDACLYVGPDLATIAVVTEAGLAETTERHKVPLQVPALAVNRDPLAELDRRDDLVGAIIGMERGWPGSSHLRFAARVLGRGRRVWLYWPQESAIECLDRERVSSYWRHWLAIAAFRARRRLSLVFSLRDPEPDEAPELADRCIVGLRRLAEDSQRIPVEFAHVGCRHHVRGLGAYVRTDYWNSITSGGSYGHTCYVAKELAATTDRFICFMANPYPLLDDYGLQQVVMPMPSRSAGEAALLGATWHYYPILKVAFDAIRPAYIYERLCLGNFAAALLSREMGIPYILEYNGSEISMRRTFDGTGYSYQDVFVRAEDAAFRQATMITVVSRVIKDSLVARGIDADKILVNPNGADPTVYAPPPPDVKRAIRADLGFCDSDRVIGFSGTFGGWHGIDVLGAAIPEICARAPEAKFLLIGDGSQKPMLDDSVATHRLESRVRSLGRVAQNEGARLLGACDVFVSPHNSHMIDSKFFGSPTKLFEYMAMERGIVASDLEQLGEVLSPSLRRQAFARPNPAIGGERSVLCTPGDVEEFVEAVVALVERPDVADQLGRNARQAVLDCYSWQHHVDRVWRFLASSQSAPDSRRERGLDRVSTGDAYKDEVQRQWNHNPVGTQYAKAAEAHTLQWYLEVEAHRYGEYAPWMPELMEFDKHADEDVLEIGAGIGTDLSQFARHGARVTDLDLSAGHIQHARENFALRGLAGRFIHHDAENLPFGDNSFDLVYSNGVLHHTPNTGCVVSEIHRVLRPRGRAIVMMYAENSLHYWRRLVCDQGLVRNLLKSHSMGDIMSSFVEISHNDARPLVKVYTATRLRRLFDRFDDIRIYKRQLMPAEMPDWLKWMPIRAAERLMGWNLVIKGTKPQA